MFIKRHSDSDGFYDLFASFNKIDGVNPGDKIMISGIDVGYVEILNWIKIIRCKNEN